MSSTIATPTSIVAAVTMTVTATVTPQPIYFESCWSILSTIGLFNTMAGFLVMGIIGFNVLVLIPIVSSIGSAIANGLCFITFYSNHSNKVKVVTSGVEDIMWMINEISIPIYSLMIVRIVIRGRERRIHHAVAGFFLATFIGTRLVVLYDRVRIFQTGVGFTPAEQHQMNLLACTSFVMTASTELWNGYFLIKKFVKARGRRQSLRVDFETGEGASAYRRGLNVYGMLARSTEVRCTALATVGIMRAVTFSFQTTPSSATNVATQADLFAAAIGHLLPVILYIDLVSSRLAFYIDKDSNRKGSSTYTGTGNSNRSNSKGGWAAEAKRVNSNSGSNAEEGRNASLTGDTASTGVYTDSAKLAIRGPIIAAIDSAPIGVLPGELSEKH